MKPTKKFQDNLQRRIAELEAAFLRFQEKINNVSIPPNLWHTSTDTYTDMTLEELLRSPFSVYKCTQK